MQVALFRNKRLIVALVIAVLIAVVFWSQSRIPALTEKAQMGLRTNFSSIAFDILLPVAPDEPAAERVAKTTVNWLYTNWKGMTFGLLFAAIALTILGSVSHRSFKRPWLNTLSGMFVGAPLGVCVNCATPIAQGMYAAGARLETALATLISSPTLNAIVLSMTFTLLPWEIALGNVVVVLLFLALLPMLVRSSSLRSLTVADTTQGIAAESFIKPPPSSTPDISESFAAALFEVSRLYARNLFYILKIAVPFMLLAGFLGALVIELAPFDRLSSISPTLVVMLATALFATFLPVPMAFNVIVVMALLTNGMDPGIGAVILFALSAYSIYPATVIARYISPKLSVMLGATVVLLATGLGMATSSYFEHELDINQQAIEAGLNDARDAAYRNVAAVCENLPGHLQRQCAANQIRASRKTIPHADSCLAIPASFPLQACQQFVALLQAEELALDSASRDPCYELGTQDLQESCSQTFLIQSAIQDHDISYCEQLGDDQLVQSCRIQYLNASLLFNPDASVCKDLTGSELALCKVNARIYRTADTLSMSSCDDLPLDAREQCRWVTATNMVGRNNDDSGCLKLASPVRRLRCQEQVIAWQAARDRSFALCDELRSEGLKDTCLLKVADRSISTILTNYSLNLSPDPSAVRNDRRTGRSVPVRDVSATVLQWQSDFENNFFKLDSVGYQVQASARNGSRAFSRVSAEEFGISKSWDFRITDFFEPFIIGKGIASGDINNDLWPDLVLASERGALFYRNTGGSFQLIDVQQGELQDQNIFLVALVDADNDGNQDLFASSYGGGNFLLMNRHNGFEQAELVRLDSEQRLTLAAGFGDIDQDNDLDIVLGNWSSGVEKLFSPEASTNYLLIRQGNSYQATPINDVKGETNSVLIADVNGDGLTDLLFGNDRVVPDIYYFGTPDRQLAPVTRVAGVIPTTSMFTMSLDSADFNNDLLPDLFSTDMTFARSAGADYCDAVAGGDDNKRCNDLRAAYEIFSKGSAVSCRELATPRDVSECYVAHSIKAAKSLKDEQYCENLPNRDGPLYSLCLHISAPIPAEQGINQDDYLPQVQRNVLLLNDGETFTDNTVQMDVGSSFWSWNAKAADLDDDGWQDIYVGNGFHFGDSFYEVQPNVLFRNTAGAGFEEVAFEWGLDDTINTPSYTYVDFDLDGDVDIVATGVLAPPRVFVNQQTKNNSVTFLLQDERGNSFAIGSRVTIEYGNHRQRKEIKLSGGFMSFDNPVAHFGIAAAVAIDGFSITWTDGQITEYTDVLPANRYYRILRKR
jgi:uncharacterized membrane protein YraQ (UPF0718 family)